MGVLADVLYLINIPRLLTPRRRAPIKNYIFMSVAFVTTLFFTLIYFTQMYFEDIILLMVVVLLFLFVFYGIAQSRADLEDDYIDREIITMERKVAGNDTKIVDLKRRQKDAKTVAEKRKLEREIIKLEQENSRTELDENRVFDSKLVEEVRRDLKDKDIIDLEELEKREKEYQRELRELTADEGAIKDVMKTNRISSLMSKQKNIQDIRDRKLGYANIKDDVINGQLKQVKRTEDALVEQRTELEDTLSAKRAELSRAATGSKAALKAEIGKIEEALQVNKETMDTTERKRAVLREGRLDNLAGIEAYNGGANIVRAEAVANDGLMRLIEQKRLKKKSTQADREVLLRAQNLTDERNAQQEALNGALALAEVKEGYKNIPFSQVIVDDKWKKLRNSSYNRMATGKETRKLDELKRQENLYERAYEAAPANKKSAAKKKLIDNNREIVEVRNNLIRLNKVTKGTSFSTGTTFDNAEAYYGKSASVRQKLDEDIAGLRDRVSKESGEAVKNAIRVVDKYNQSKKESDILGSSRRKKYMLNRHELDKQSAIPSKYIGTDLGLETRKIYKDTGKYLSEGTSDLYSSASVGYAKLKRDVSVNSYKEKERAVKEAKSRLENLAKAATEAAKAERKAEAEAKAAVEEAERKAEAEAEEARKAAEKAEAERKEAERKAKVAEDRERKAERKAEAEAGKARKAAEKAGKRASNANKDAAKDAAKVAAAAAAAAEKAKERAEAAKAAAERAAAKAAVKRVAVAKAAAAKAKERAAKVAVAKAAVARAAAAAAKAEKEAVNASNNLKKITEVLKKTGDLTREDILKLEETEKSAAAAKAKRAAEKEEAERQIFETEAETEARAAEEVKRAEEARAAAEARAAEEAKRAAAKVRAEKEEALKKLFETEEETKARLEKAEKAEKETRKAREEIAKARKEAVTKTKYTGPPSFDSDDSDDE